MGRPKAPKCSLDVVAQRFWARVNKTDSCWLWTASVRRGGYGQMWDGEKINAAHRLSWELANGPIQDGLWVLHKCDTPRCVNPGHLFLGTDLDNKHDMANKGRRKGKNGGLFGANHGMAKLNESQVLEIRELAASGLVARREIGRRFGVTRQQVTLIHKRKSWRHVP